VHHWLRWRSCLHLLASKKCYPDLNHARIPVWDIATPCDPSRTLLHDDDDRWCCGGSDQYVVWWHSCLASQEGHTCFWELSSWRLLCCHGRRLRPLSQ